MAAAKKAAAKKKAADSGKSASDKASDDFNEVQKIHAEQVRQEREDRYVARRTITGADGEGEIRFVGRTGEAFVEIDGEVRLDRDGVAELKRVADALIQAVGL